MKGSCWKFACSSVSDASVDKFTDVDIAVEGDQRRAVAQQPPHGIGIGTCVVVVPEQIDSQLRALGQKRAGMGKVVDQAEAFREIGCAQSQISPRRKRVSELMDLAMMTCYSLERVNDAL